MIKKMIEYVNKEFNRLNVNNISIYVGSLTEKQLGALRKHFTIEKEFLGYYCFRKLKEEK